MEVTVNLKAVFLQEDLHQLLPLETPAAPKVICATQDGQEVGNSQSEKQTASTTGLIRWYMQFHTQAEIFCCMATKDEVTSFLTQLNSSNCPGA